MKVIRQRFVPSAPFLTSCYHFNQSVSGWICRTMWQTVRQAECHHWRTRRTRINTATSRKGRTWSPQTLRTKSDFEKISHRSWTSQVALITHCSVLRSSSIILWGRSQMFIVKLKTQLFLCTRQQSFEQLNWTESKLRSTILSAAKSCTCWTVQPV